MACETDYRAIPDAQLFKRIDTALKELTQGGVSVHKAISVIAVSGNECGYIWNQTRAPTLWFENSPCWQCRGCVGWEFGLARVGETQVRILHDANKEKEALAYLQDNGLATMGTSGHLLATQKLSTPANNDNIARWFEWAVSNRRADLLPNWSVGPTQMYLYWSALTIGVAPNRGKTVDPRWLNTWEQVFNYHMASSALARANAITYLDPSYNGVDAWPSQRPTDADLAIAWLTPRQVGNKAAATTYYNNLFKQRLAETVGRAKALGLI